MSKKSNYKEKIFIGLLADNMLYDYLDADTLIPTEVEKFAEHWFLDNLKTRSLSLRRKIWKEFLNKLYEYRRFTSE